MLEDSNSDVSVKTIELLPAPLRWVVQSFWVIGTVVLVAIVLNCVGAFVLGADIVSSLSAWILFPLFLCFVIVPVLGIAVPFLLNMPNPWNRRAAKIVRRCFACAYSLDGITVEQDGCTVCPECGAAWKLESKDEG